MPAAGAVKMELVKADGRRYYLNVFTGGTVVWARTKALDLGDGSVRKVLQRMILNMSHRADLTLFTLTISCADNRTDTFVEETPITITDTTAPIDLRVRNSRYYKFKFLDEHAVNVWKLSGFELLGTIAGKRAN